LRPRAAVLGKTYQPFSLFPFPFFLFHSPIMKPALLRPSSTLFVMLSMSIGWGIRGNYGHETGAMIPGALVAIAVALMSGREDWRNRAPYFACLGALGWALGGATSYMPPPSYTETGQLGNQAYGFLSSFVM